MLSWQVRDAQAREAEARAAEARAAAAREAEARAAAAREAAAREAEAREAAAREAAAREAAAREAEARAAAAYAAKVREVAAREAAAREVEVRRSTLVADHEALLSLSDDGTASLTLPPVSTAASSPLDGEPTTDDRIDDPVLEPDDEVAEIDLLGDADDHADLEDLDADDDIIEIGELGDELDAELEAEAAAMAPLVELPDRAAFGADADPEPAVTSEPSGTGDLITVRVRGHGRVPARKVRRVIRRVDPLSVLKLSFAFSLCLFAMFLVAAVLLWSAAIGSGSTDNIESFIVDIGFEDFKLVGADLFRGFVVFGGTLVIAGTVFAVLVALLFNLISDIVGGIRFTVIEPVLSSPDDADLDEL